MRVRSSLISITLAAILVGCGSDSDGSSGVEKKSVVCLDVNRNAICEASETSEQVVTWDGVNPVETTLSGSVPLAYKGEKGYIFTAPVGFSKIYAGTTMMQSELIYNQLIESKTTASVKSYVHGKFGAEPTTEQKKDVADVIKNAITTHANADRYAVIAAVMHKVIALAPNNADEIKDITVTAAEVSAADFPSLAKLSMTENFAKDFTVNIDQQIADGWVNASDASIGYLSAKNGKVVGSSHYHNALSVVDASSKNGVFSPVSIITDSGHHIDSASGASENYARDVVVNSDASYVYVNIPPKSFNSTTADSETMGLYKAKIESDGSIATVTESLQPSGQRIKIDETNSKRLNKKVSLFAVASDDSKVAVYDNEKNLFIYDGDLNSQISAMETDGLSAITLGTDTFYAAVDENITTYNASTLSAVDTISLGFEPEEMFVNDEGTKLVAFNHGHDNNGVTEIAVINLTDNSVETSSVKHTSDSAGISPDFTKMALAGHEESKVMLVNLTVPGLSVQALYDVDGARDAAFLSNDQLAVVNDQNSIAVLNVTTTTGNNNLDAKIALAKESLNKDTINGGGYLNAVIKDITLSDSYENIAISWSENDLADNLRLSDGNVTRPAEDASDVSGNLTATFSATFRDVTKTDTKVFPVNIRKLPQTLPVPNVLEITGTGIQYMAANSDGSIMVAPVRGTFLIDDENVTKYGMASYAVSAGGEISVATQQRLYAEDEEIVGVGINGSSAFGVAAKEASGRIFSIAVAGNGVLGGAVLNSVDITSGIPQKVEWNSDQSLAVVLIKEADDTFIAEVYDTSLTLQRTIDMGTHEYASYGPAGMNDAGTRVYQRDGDNVYAIASDGTQIATVAVEEVARVWTAFNRVFVTTYDGNLFSFDEDLADQKIFSTGTGGRIYGAEGRVVDGVNYLYLPVQRSDEALNGIYQLRVLEDGSLEEVAFSQNDSGADRMAVSGDGNRIFFSFRD